MFLPSEVDLFRSPEPRAPFKRTIAMIARASIHSPAMNEMIVAVARAYVTNPVNCFASSRTVPGSRLMPTLFGPVMARRSAASAEDRPRSKSEWRRDATSETVKACAPRDGVFDEGGLTEDVRPYRLGLRRRFSSL